MKTRRRGVLVGGVVVAVAVVAILRVVGLLWFFRVDGRSMEPTISRGDWVVMEGFTFLLRMPGRDDVVAMRTDGMPGLSEGAIYIKRIVGRPGDRLRLANGELYVNDRRVSLRSKTEEIRHRSVAGEQYLTTRGDTVTVPTDHYFVVGDNSAESADSRVWGFLPRSNIVARPWLRYWPLGEFGGVR